MMLALAVWILLIPKDLLCLDAYFLTPDGIILEEKLRNNPEVDQGQRNVKRESESDSNPEANLLPPSLFNNVQPQVGISHSSGFKVTPLDFHSAAVRSIIERKKRQTFPNFSQLSGSSQNIGNPQFPNTQSQVQSSSVDFPDIMSQPFRIPSSIQQQFDRKKRQTLL